MKYLHWISQNRILWLLFIFNIAAIIGFYFWRQSVGPVILDQVGLVEDLIPLLRGMSESQKTSHFWMTLTLDMAYPFIYGLFFAGLTFKFLGNISYWFALPALLVIPIDILENTVQLFALNGYNEGLEYKPTLTPAKFFLFSLAGLIAATALFIGISRWATTRFNRA